VNTSLVCHDCGMPVPALTATWSADIAQPCAQCGCYWAVPVEEPKTVQRDGESLEEIVADLKRERGLMTADVAAPTHLDKICPRCAAPTDWLSPSRWDGDRWICSSCKLHERYLDEMLAEEIPPEQWPVRGVNAQNEAFMEAALHIFGVGGE